MENNKVGIIVGRFQTPHVHLGHLHLIQTVVNKHKRVIIFLGTSAMKFSRRNPYPFEIRKQMIKGAFPSVEIYPLPDLGNLKLWNRQLDDTILQYVPSGEVVLYGSRRSFIQKYDGQYPKIQVRAYSNYSATDIRLDTAKVIIDHVFFRKGIVYAIENQYSSCKATVDIAILDRKKQRVLLGRKPNQELFRFVGGFSDVDSPSYEADACRETKEETSLSVKNPLYIGSCIIDDIRYRGEADKIKTLFFVAEYQGGVPKAKDDIVEVKWFDIATLDKSAITPTHYPLYNMFEKWLLTQIETRWTRAECCRLAGVHK